ncbi:MAG: response regulator transcription factor [Lachnospiraceae bacterium]|nr:response regulator transcription factor [Lachnospiraceae bacterium]HCJ08657.1 DNA-binding response regulator [Lachnospiraceae bacterium]
MAEKQKILVADDARDIREVVRIMLEDAGFEVILAVNGEEAVEKFNADIDLVILDIMMPECDGINACSRIRERAEVPVLFLTAKSAESDLIEGFEAGGDDYLTKPFSCTELLLRVKALLKRPHIEKSDAKSKSQIVIQDIILDTDLQQVVRDGQEISLTEIEYRILLLLASNRNHIFTAKEIYEAVWEEAYMPNSTNTVMVHIRNIRKKLGDTGPSPKYVHNIWGRGYRVV